MKSKLLSNLSSPFIINKSGLFFNHERLKNAQKGKNGRFLRGKEVADPQKPAEKQKYT
jgi:hypothetical protein